MDAAGIRNVLTKSLRSSNPHNVVKAVFDAFERMESPSQYAIRLGKVADEVLDDYNVGERVWGAAF